MNEDEYYCGTICLAARMLGIVAKWEGGGLVWLDRVTGTRIFCAPDSNQKAALKTGCDKLVEYLNK